MDDDGSGFFTSVDVELIGCLSLTDDPAPDCECREGSEAAADPQAPPRPTVRWARGCDGLPKISGACDNTRWGFGVMPFPGTPHERSILSRSFALSLFERFAPFLPFSPQRSSVSTSLTALVSSKSSSTMPSRLQSGACEYGHRDEPLEKVRASTRVAGEVPIRGAGTVGTGEGQAWEQAWLPLRLGRSRKELAYKGGRMQPQLEESTARGDAVARWRGRKNLFR